MNIGQIARNQQMYINIASKALSGSYSSTPSASSSSSSKLSAYSGLLYGFGGSAKDVENNFFSTPGALKGSVRQIAKRLYDASFSPDALAGENTSSTQGVNTAGADQTLAAIRKQLGSKVESMQQLHQPDRAALLDNFAQLQAVADNLVSRLQTVSLSDETTKKIQELALKDAKNTAGALEAGEAADASALSRMNRLSMIQEEVQKFAPSKRSAAFNTINKVWQNEMDRIGEYIKEKNPDWVTWGDKFDASILDDYKPGLNVWV